MKKRFTFAVLTAIVVGIAALIVLPVPTIANAGAVLIQASEPTPGPSLDPTIVEAILVIVTGGVVTLITQFLKKKLKWEGTLARLLDGSIGVVVVGVYFLIINPPFDVIKFALYSIVIFGESTGWFHLYQKKVV